MKFTVRAPRKERFPFDMLRRDRCWPADDNSAAMLDRIAERRTAGLPALVIVTLETDEKHLSVERWASFGWTVINMWVAEIGDVPVI